MINQHFTKKGIVVFAAMFISLVPIQAIAGSWNGWIYQNPYPTSNTLLAVQFVTPKIGWMAGKYGTILHTKDGGENWEAQESGTTEMLKSIFFTDDRTGWIVGDKGIILHTEDSGKKWIKLGKHNLSLNKVFFVNKNVGWAVGTEGLVLHTNDGGRHWLEQKSETSLNLKQVQFIDKKRGWIIGDKILSKKPKDYPEDIHWMEAIILYTEDGGEHWFKQWSGREMKLRHVLFINKNIGWINGQNVIFYEFMTEATDLFLRTEDGGKTWVNDNGRKGKSGIPFFINEKRGWMVANEHTVLLTEDGGTTWKEQKAVLHKYPWRPFEDAAKRD